MNDNNPQIVFPQNPANSKVVLTNVFGSVLVWVVAKYGLGTIFSPDLVNQIATALALAVMSAANLVIRKYTSGMLSFSAPLTQPKPQPLPPGTHMVTVVAPPPVVVPPPSVSIVTQAPS